MNSLNTIRDVGLAVQGFKHFMLISKHSVSGWFGFYIPKTANTFFKFHSKPC